MVTDFKGRQIPKEKARFIKGKYYEVGVDCIIYSGMAYRVTSKKVILDHSTGQYVHINKAGNMLHGLVGKGGKQGYFSNTPECIQVSQLKEIPASHDAGAGRLEGSSRMTLEKLESRPVRKGDKTYVWKRSMCLNSGVAKENGFIEALSSEVWYKESDCDKTMLAGVNVKMTPEAERGQGVYNLEDAKDKGKLAKAYEELEIPIGGKARRFALHVPYSFGLEFELTKGFIPQRIRSKYGLKTLRDGSVAESGTEVVTSPMSGAKGIQALKDLSEVFTKRCAHDSSCSLHVHFGGFERTKIFTLGLYRLAFLLQDELFKAFPPSRTVGKNGKNYCQKLPDIGLSTNKLLKAKTKEEYDNEVVNQFSRIYQFLNGTPPGHIYNKKTEKVREEVEGEEVFRYIVKHERYTTKSTVSAHRGNKWTNPTRYFYLNLLPAYFSSYGTVEFRVHEPTFNKYKIMMWLALCAAIVGYAKRSKEIFSATKITLEEVIRGYYSGEYADCLVAYWRSRRGFFCTAEGNYRENIAQLEQEWMANDETYVFKHNGKNPFV